MPVETQAAIAWALQQTDVEGNAITAENHIMLVSKVRDYFNANNIPYGTFAFADLEPLLGN